MRPAGVAAAAPRMRPKRVLAAMDGTNVTWDRHVDRDVADSVRREVLEDIEKL